MEVQEQQVEGDVGSLPRLQISGRQFDDAVRKVRSGVAKLDRAKLSKQNKREATPADRTKEVKEQLEKILPGLSRTFAECTWDDDNRLEDDAEPPTSSSKKPRLRSDARSGGTATAADDQVHVPKRKRQPCANAKYYVQNPLTLEKESKSYGYSAFRRRVVALAKEHLRPKYVKDEPLQLDADVSLLRQDPAKLQEVLKKMDLIWESARTEVMGCHSRELLALTETALANIQAMSQPCNNNGGGVDVMNMAALRNGLENCRRSLLDLGKDKVFTFLGGQGRGKSTVLASLLHGYMDLGIYRTDPFPNNLVLMLSAIDFMRERDKDNDRSMFELLEDTTMLKVHMPLDYGKDVAQEEYARTKALFEQFGETGNLHNLHAFTPVSSGEGRPSTNIAIAYKYGPYITICLELSPVEKVQKSLVQLLRFLADRFDEEVSELTADEYMGDGKAAAAEVHKAWTAWDEHGKKPAWMSVPQTHEYADAWLVDTYRALCGDKLPFKEGVSGYWLPRDYNAVKIKDELEDLLSKHRFIAITGPERPSHQGAPTGTTVANAGPSSSSTAGPSTGAAGTPDPTMGTPGPTAGSPGPAISTAATIQPEQVALWAMDLLAHLQGLGDINRGAVTRRLESSLPKELQGLDWKQLAHVLELPVKCYVPVSVLVGVGEDLPGSGVTNKAHDTITGTALTSRVNLAIVLTDNGLAQDKPLQGMLSEHYIPEMMRAAVPQLAQSKQPQQQEQGQAAAGSSTTEEGRHSATVLRSCKVALVHLGDSRHSDYKCAENLQANFDEAKRKTMNCIEDSTTAWIHLADVVAKKKLKALTGKSMHQLPAEVQKLVVDMPSKAVCPLLDFSLRLNAKLCRKLEERKPPNYPNTVTLLEYMDHQFILQLLVASTREELLQLIDNLSQVLKDQVDIKGLQELLQDRLPDRAPPPEAANGKLRKRGEAVDDRNLEAAEKCLETLHEELVAAAEKAAACLAAEVEKTISPSTAAGPGTSTETALEAGQANLIKDWWNRCGKKLQKKPDHYLQPSRLGKHADANLYEVPKSLLSKALAEALPEVDGCFRNCITKFVNSAAKELSGAAVCYYQKYMKMSPEDSTTMVNLIDDSYEKQVSSMLRRVLMDRLPVADLLQAELSNSLDTQMLRMLNNLHNPDADEDAEGVRDPVRSDSPAVGEKRHSRAAEATEAVPEATNPLRRRLQEAMPDLLRGVEDDLEDHIRNLPTRIHATVSTITLTTKRYKRCQKLLMDDKVRTRGQFQAIFCTIVRDLDARRLGMTGKFKSKHEKDLSLLLNSNVSSLKNIRTKVEALPPGGQEHVVSTKRPPILVTKPGLPFTKLEKQEVDSESAGPGVVTGVVTRTPKDVWSRFDRLHNRATSKGPTPCAHTIYSPVYQQRGNQLQGVSKVQDYHRTLDSALEKLDLKRVGVARDGDRLLSALLVGLTGETKTPAQPKDVQELRLHGVQAALDLMLKDEKFADAMDNYLQLGEGRRWDTPSDWCHSMQQPGAGADYFLLQGIVQAQGIRLLVWLPALPGNTQAKLAVDPAVTGTPVAGVSTRSTIANSTPAAAPPTQGIESGQAAASDAAGLQSSAGRRASISQSAPLDGGDCLELLLLEPIRDPKSDLASTHLPVYGITLVADSKLFRGNPYGHVEAVVPIAPLDSDTESASDTDGHPAVADGAREGEAEQDSSDDDDEAGGTGQEPGKLADPVDAPLQQLELRPQQPAQTAPQSVYEAPLTRAQAAQQRLHVVLDISVLEVDVRYVKALCKMLQHLAQLQKYTFPRFVYATRALLDYVYLHAGQELANPSIRQQNAMHLYPLLQRSSHLAKFDDMNWSHIEQELISACSRRNPPVLGEDDLQLHKTLIYAKWQFDREVKWERLLVVYRHELFKSATLLAKDTSATPLAPPHGRWIHLADLRQLVQGVGDDGGDLLTWFNSRQAEQPKGAQWHLAPHFYWVKRIA